MWLLGTTMWLLGTTMWQEYHFVVFYVNRLFFSMYIVIFIDIYCDIFEMIGNYMDNKEFSLIRHYLGKTQKQIALLLCVSTKAIQSFEEGWRNIPAYAEKQLLFLLSLKRSTDEKTEPCWEIRNCSIEWRENCSAWEFKAGHFCWFINGTFCQGEWKKNWEQKMIGCRQCEVFQSMIPSLI